MRAISTHVYLKPQWLMLEGVNLKLYALLCFVEHVAFPLKPRYPYISK